MSRNKRWLAAAALLGGGILAYSLYRQRHRGPHVPHAQGQTMLHAGLYDAVTAPLIGGFFARVAKDLAALSPRARVLEVGSGPGRLAAKLAEVAPEVRVTGVDIAPDMVERAGALAARSGVADRVAFQVGDVAALPFPDASFDAAVSTFSLHHWSNPARGLAEIYRVLRPGGVARVYDFAAWIRRGHRGGPGVAELVQDSPFGERGAYTEAMATRLGPIPLVYRAELRREPPE
jgi:SAM-dependent methyltransferase